MVYYMSIFLGLYALSIFDIFNVKYKQKKIIFYFVSCVLILFAGLRYNTGYDYFNYIEIFQKTDSFSDIINFDLEPGYSFLNWFINITFGSPYVLIFIVAAITIILKIKFIKRYSPYLFFPLFYYYALDFLPRDMGQIRHALAISILLISIKYILDRNFLKFFICVLVATSIHYTSILFISAYFLNKIDLNRKKIIFFILISFLFACININEYILRLTEFFPRMAPIETAIRHIKIHPEKTGRRGLALTELWRIGILLVNLIYYNKLYSNNNYVSKKLFNIYFFGVIIYFSLNSNAMFARRFSQVNMFLEGIIIVNIFYLFKNILSKFIALIPLGVVMYIRFIRILSDIRFQDYQTIFSMYAEKYISLLLNLNLIFI